MATVYLQHSNIVLHRQAPLTLSSEIVEMEYFITMHEVLTS